MTPRGSPLMSGYKQKWRSGLLLCRGVVNRTTQLAGNASMQDSSSYTRVAKYVPAAVFRHQENSWLTPQRHPPQGISVSLLSLLRSHDQFAILHLNVFKPFQRGSRSGVAVNAFRQIMLPDLFHIDLRNGSAFYLETHGGQSNPVVAQ